MTCCIRQSVVYYKHNMLFINPFIRRLKLLKERSDFMKLIKKLTALSLSLAIIGTSSAISKAIVPSSDNTLIASAAEVPTYNYNGKELDKNYCLTVAKQYTAQTGLSQLRIAKEIYAHAYMYLFGDALMYKLKMEADNSIIDLAYYKASKPALDSIHESCADGVQIGDDDIFRLIVFDLIWHIT